MPASGDGRDDDDGGDVRDVVRALSSSRVVVSPNDRTKKTNEERTKKTNEDVDAEMDDVARCANDKRASSTSTSTTTTTTSFRRTTNDERAPTTPVMWNASFVADVLSSEEDDRERWGAREVGAFWDGRFVTRNARARDERADDSVERERVANARTKEILGMIARAREYVANSRAMGKMTGDEDEDEDEDDGLDARARAAWKRPPTRFATTK